MIHDWPAQLPPPERDSWRMTTLEARRKTTPEAGPPRYRRRFSAVPKLVTLSWVLARWQRQVFDEFYEATRFGSELFRMADPTTDGWPLLDAQGVPVLTQTGQPVLMSGIWLCAWGDELPTETISGIEFRKTASIVVMP